MSKYKLKENKSFIQRSNNLFILTNFNLLNHDSLKYFTFNIFNTDIDNKFKRLALESQLINLHVYLGVGIINFKHLGVYIINLNAM